MISTLGDVLNNLLGSTEFKTFIGFLSAIITAAFGKIVYDMIKAPKLVSYVPRNGEPAVQSLSNSVTRGFYHIIIKNERRRVIDRSVAGNARVGIVFMEDNGAKKFSLSGKWDWRPEPLSVSGNRPVIEPSLIPFAELVDINPADEQPFCIVMKYDGQDECYAFNASSYLYLDHKNPAWKLGLGRYKIHLTLNGSNVHREFDFILENKGKLLSDISISKTDC